MGFVHEASAPADLVDPAVPVGATPTCSVPSSAAHDGFLFPTCGVERDAELVGARIGDDLVPSTALRLPCAPAVKHGGGVPAEGGRRVSAHTETVHLEDAASHQCRGDRVADYGHAEQSWSVEDRLMETPSDGQTAMGMMAGDESADDSWRGAFEVQLPIQEEATSPIIDDAPQPVSAERLHADRADEGTSPCWIVTHLHGDLVVKTPATGFQHEFMAPDLEDLRPFGLTAK